VVLGVMVIIFTAMIIFIVPVFKNLFSSLGGTLPLPTRILISISQIITSPWVLLIIIGIVGAVVGVRRWIGTDDGRRTWDRLMLKPPVFGQLFHKLALARVSSTLSSLIHSGVPILEALDISAETAGNRTVGDVLIAAKQGVREGRPLADTLRDDDDVIPVLVTQMVEVGEQTGALDAMLAKVAQFYDQEVEVTVNNLTALLEPLLTVVMGIGVGMMVISLYLPMFSYIKLIHN
jgi:type IV pilus assembly protein PilC